jgi:hypothetical protein
MLSQRLFRIKCKHPLPLVVFWSDAMKKILPLVISLLALEACVPMPTLAEYRPVVDPAKDGGKKYESDLQACLAIATKVQEDYKARAAREQQNNMVAGLLLGAVAGAAIGGNGRSAAAGAAYGTAAGVAADGDYGHDLVTYGPQRVVDRCMTERGHVILNDVGRG